MSRAQVTPQQLGCLPMKQALARGENSQGSMRRGRSPLQAARRDHDLRLMRSFYRISLLSSAQGRPFEIATRVLRDANDLTAHGVGVGLCGGIDSKDMMRSMVPRGVAVDRYVEEIRSQLAWCHKTDDVTELAQPLEP